MQPLLNSFLVLFFFTSLAHSHHSSGFDPRSYELKTVSCRSHPDTLQFNSSDLTIEYIEIGPTEKTVLLMVHGWPGLWSTWSKQIRAFQSDYHLVLPNLRGFGGSEHPPTARSGSSMGELVGDLVCVLTELRVEKVLCVGHDWGSQVCFQAARMRPDVFQGVVDIVVPYMPFVQPFLPIANLVPQFPMLGYQVYFDKMTDQAILELNQDVRRSLRATLRTVQSPPPSGFLTSKTSYLTPWDGVAEIPPIPFLSSVEEDYLVEQYQRQGFNYTLGFYTTGNRYSSWEQAIKQGNVSIPCPVLSILPKSDPVANWEVASKMLSSAEYVSLLTTKFVDGAHWVHLENPTVVNQEIKRWLGVFNTLSKPDQYRKHIDEL